MLTHRTFIGRHLTLSLVHNASASTCGHILLPPVCQRRAPCRTPHILRRVMICALRMYGRCGHYSSKTRREEVSLSVRRLPTTTAIVHDCNAPMFSLPTEKGGLKFEVAVMWQRQEIGRESDSTGVSRPFSHLGKKHTHTRARRRTARPLARMLEIPTGH